MPHKQFHQLSTEEATAVVKGIANSSNSEDEIKRRLTEAGFNGNAAAITSTSHERMFMAMVMVNGPHGEIIQV